MASAQEKFHIQARRAERKTPAAGSCSRFWKGAGRRAAALLLVTALALGMVGTALAQEVAPLQVTDLAEFPTITIETNLVMNEASKEPEVVTDADGNKFGFIEVALRVTPGSSGLFSGVAVALTYDQNLLTPVTWNEFDEATQKRDKYGVVTVPAPAVPYSTFLPTKKADIISSASAFIGGTDASGKALLYLSAEAETPTKLTGDSRLAVVRFRYDATAHPLRYDGGDGGSNQIMDGTNPVEFLAWAGDASAAASPAGASAYFTGKSEPTVRESMYYVHAAPNPGDVHKWPVHTTENIAKPDTDCLQLVKAVKATGTDVDPDYYSYATNFFPVDPDYIAAINDGTVTTFPAPDASAPLTPKIQFTQITAATADQGSGGISLDDLSTILFYDWDDTLLGALTVPKGVDVREEVNAYVRDNFIHPDLRYDKEGKEGKADLALLNNTARTNSYRGTFPHDNPGGAEGGGNSTPEDGDGDGVIDATAGSRFPLTNKLDYVFFKKPMRYDGLNEMWLLNDSDFSAEYDDEYPYIYGWAVTDLANVTNMWTTLGTGELSDYYCEPSYVELPISDEPMKTIFQFANFTGISESVVCAKAVYEPGDRLEDTDYTASGLWYTRYGTNGSANNGTYSIQFTYDRINGNVGVTRIRKPSVRVTMSPDASSLDGSVRGNVDWMYWDIYDWLAGNYGVDLESFMTIDDVLLNYEFGGYSVASFPSEVTVTNDEKISVDITPSSGIRDVSYALVENYGKNNYVEAGTRSAGDEFGVMYNFATDAAINDRQGTDGFVFKGSLGILLEQGTLKAKNESNTYDVHVTLGIFQDLNLRYNATTEFNAVWTVMGRNALATAISDALSRNWVDERGIVDLSWHQLQYYLINGRLESKGTAEAAAYSWYRGPAL